MQRRRLDALCGRGCGTGRAGPLCVPQDQHSQARDGVRRSHCCRAQASVARLASRRTARPKVCVSSFFFALVLLNVSALTFFISEKTRARALVLLLILAALFALIFLVLSFFPSPICCRHRYSDADVRASRDASRGAPCPCHGHSQQRRPHQAFGSSVLWLWLWLWLWRPSLGLSLEQLWYALCRASSANCLCLELFVPC